MAIFPVIGSIISGLFGLGAGAAKSKADKQAGNTVAAAGKDVQNYEKQQLAASNAELNPYITGGQGAFNTVAQLMQQGAAGQGPLASWNQTFQAPTNVTEANDPGFQFRMQEGEKALEDSAAARGGLLSAGTGKQLQQYGQGLASEEYGNVYNRAMQQYQQQYLQFQNNQSNLYNRLMGIGSTGLSAAQTSVGANMQGAQLYGNEGLTAAQAQAGYQAQAGGAKAIGIAGLGNSIGNAMGGIGSIAQNWGQPQQLTPAGGLATG